ncbi:MAG: hypothetical protein M0Z85_09440 [Gammaproteobacteria bacterium]|nr:hypothetical protein [Gammaproteobacteria bacterium]
MAYFIFFSFLSDLFLFVRFLVGRPLSWLRAPVWVHDIVLAGAVAIAVTLVVVVANRLVLLNRQTVEEQTVEEREGAERSLATLISPLFLLGLFVFLIILVIWLATQPLSPT